jgi:acyl-coenzyme A synthetase/AMP-(fatty) acid ligase
LRTHPVTICDGTPGYWRVLSESLDIVPTGRLRYVLLGGEPVDAAIVRRIYQARGLRAWPKVVNLYGPTECCVDATAAIVESPETCSSIGTPLGNVRCYVLDPGGRLVGPSMVGELHIAGAGVARGYLNQPGLTRSRFLPDPFVSGALMFRTGDLAFWREDGGLELRGRMDRQVKINGYRIELDEIETRLRAHPALKTAVVEFVAPLDRAERLLTAYFVSDDVALTEQMLREHMKLTLPEYMVPVQWVTLDRPPLTANGKVNRSALPRPRVTAPVGRVAGDPLESELARLFISVLGIEEIDATQSFFASGGDSLKAVRLLQDLRRRWSCALSMADLVHAPSVTSLATVIKSRRVLQS